MLWSGAVAALLFDAKTELDDGRARLEAAVSIAKSGQLDEAEAELSSGAASLRAARDDLASPILFPLRFVPVVGRQLRSALAITELGADGASEAERFLDLLDLDSTESGAPGLQALDLVAAEQSLRRIHELLVQPDLGPSDGLVAPLHEARTTVAGLIADYEPSVGSAVVVLRGLRSVETDSSYVVLGANNAEMQLAGGMILSAGEIRFTDGEIEFAGLNSTEDMFPVPVTPVVDDDVDQRWGFLRLTNDFRKLGVSPRFDEFVGPQAVSMWEAETGTAVDGAIMVDTHALSRLLGVVGTVEIDGTTYSEDTLLDYLLREQYAAFGDSDQEQERRRRELASVTSAVFDAIIAGPHDTARLVEVIPSLLSGRHLTVYSEVAEQQAAWAEIGADGSTDGRQVGVYVLNLGASKLDPYVAVDVRVTEETVGDTTTLDLVIDIRNEVEDADRLPSYVVGPWEWIDLDEPGEYLGRLAVVLPGSTTEAAFVSDVPLEVFGPDGQGVVLGTRFTVRPGGTTTIRLRAQIPSSLESISLVPSTRPRPIVWQWADDVFDDAESRVIVLDVD